MVKQSLSLCLDFKPVKEISPKLHSLIAVLGAQPRKRACISKAKGLNMSSTMDFSIPTSPLFGARTTPIRDHSSCVEMTGINIFRGYPRL